MRGQTVDYVVRAQSASVSQDEDGFTTRAAPTDSTVRGYVAEISVAEAANLGALGQSIDVVAQAPLSTVVTDRDLLIVTLPEGLAGTYQVEAVSVLRKGKRILGRRLTHRD